MTNALPKLAKDKPLRLAIIGGGAGAREFIIHFLEAGAHEFPVEISIFEPSLQPGRGIAWQEEKTPTLANMRVETLGPSYQEYDLIQTLLNDLNHPEANEEYPTCRAMGIALDERWRRKTQHLPSGWRIVWERALAVDIAWDGSSAAITTEDSIAREGYDLVLLAIGNLKKLAPKEFEGNWRFINGWDTAAIERVQPNSDVLIIGSGLSAIDVTMRLLEFGHSKGDQSIVWHSRSGMLPYVRPRQLKLDASHLTYPELDALTKRATQENKPLTLKTLFRLFELEIKSQSKKLEGLFASGTDYAGFLAMHEHFSDASKGRELIDFGIKGATAHSLWFSVAKLLDEYVIPFVWNALPDSEKASFLEQWRRDFDCFWAPIPVANGRRVKQWLDDGTVQLVRTGINYQIHSESGKIKFDPRLDDPLGERSKAELRLRYQSGFDYLIDSSGIPDDLDTIDSKLIPNLLQRGTITPHKIPRTDGKSFRTVGIKLDWYSGAVLAQDDRPHGWLYTLTGSLTCGAHRFTNSYLAVSISAKRTASDLMRRLTE